MKAPYETEEVKEVETEIEKYKKDKFIAEQNWQIKKKLIKVRRRTYAQYIFRWLGERYRVEVLLSYLLSNIVSAEKPESKKS